MCCVFLIDGLTVSHLHPPAHRRPSRACCPWLTCSHQTLVCKRPGAIAKQRTTRTAAQPARSRAAWPEQVTASDRPNACPRRRKRAAAWTVWTCSTMTRTTWKLALGILITVSSSNLFFYSAYSDSSHKVDFVSSEESKRYFEKVFLLSIKLSWTQTFRRKKGLEWLEGE